MDKELAAGKRRGPLHGVPMAHKDMYYREGEISTGGSAIRRNWVAPVTATALQKLDAAGVVELGFLNMAEFAAGPTGHNVHHGHCRNPWDDKRVTGGSSSGSGASVARAHGLWRAGLRHRRLDPPARLGLRRGRHEGDLRPRQPRRRRRALVDARPCRAAHAHGARQCAHAGRRRRPRSRRFDDQREAGAGLRGAARRRRARPQDRPRPAERRSGAARCRRSAPPCRPRPMRWASSARRSRRRRCPTSPRSIAQPR